MDIWLKFGAAVAFMVVFAVMAFVIERHGVDSGVTAEWAQAVGTVLAICLTAFLTTRAERAEHARDRRDRLRNLEGAVRAAHEAPRVMLDAARLASMGKGRVRAIGLGLVTKVDAAPLIDAANILQEFAIRPLPYESNALDSIFAIRGSLLLTVSAIQANEGVYGVDIEDIVKRRAQEIFVRVQTLRKDYDRCRRIS